MADNAGSLKVPQKACFTVVGTAAARDAESEETILRFG